VEKNAEKRVKKREKNKYQSVTHVSSCILQGLFKNIVLRSVALVTKKLWAILEFFFLQTVLISALYRFP